MLNAAKLVTILVVVAVAELANGEKCIPVSEKPEVKVQKYMYGNCILSTLAGYFTLPDGTYLPIEDGSVSIEDSICSKSKHVERLAIDFNCGELMIDFKRNEFKQTYANQIWGYLDTGNHVITFSDSTPAFNTSAPGHYYKCDSEQTITIANIKLTLKNVGFELLREVDTKEFYQIPDKCSLDLN